MQQNITATKNHMLRFAQLFIIIPLAIREWINFLTDIGQIEDTAKFAYKIINFPTLNNTNALFNRSISSMPFAKFISYFWVFFHAISGMLITIGIIYMLVNFSKDTELYQSKKKVCMLGLSITFFGYILLLGAGSMDLFLSWMQNPPINYNLDIVGYGFPVGVALIFLQHK